MSTIPEMEIIDKVVALMVPTGRVDLVLFHNLFENFPISLNVNVFKGYRVFDKKTPFYPLHRG